jgi:hypothetical protein
MTPRFRWIYSWKKPEAEDLVIVSLNGLKIRNDILHGNIDFYGSYNYYSRQLEKLCCLVHPAQVAAVDPALRIYQLPDVSRQLPPDSRG